MKKVIPVIAVLVLLLTLTAALVGCTDKVVTIESYYIEYPEELDSFSYKAGQTFSDADLKIVCILSDKSEKYVPVSNADVTKIIYEDSFNALVDKDKKFLDTAEVKTGYITVKFLDELNADGYTVRIKITVRPKG